MSVNESAPMRYRTPEEVITLVESDRGDTPRKEFVVGLDNIYASTTTGTTLRLLRDEVKELGLLIAPPERNRNLRVTLYRGLLLGRHVARKTITSGHVERMKLNDALGIATREYISAQSLNPDDYPDDVSIQAAVASAIIVGGGATYDAAREYHDFFEPYIPALSLDPSVANAARSGFGFSLDSLRVVKDGLDSELG